MLLLGMGNSIGYGVMIAYLNMLSAKFDRSLQFYQFVVFIQAVPIIARFVNASFFIKTIHYLRLFLVIMVQLLAYILLIIAFVKPDDDVGIPCATFACVLYLFA